MSLDETLLDLQDFANHPAWEALQERTSVFIEALLQRAARSTEGLHDFERGRLSGAEGLRDFLLTLKTQWQERHHAEGPGQGPARRSSRREAGA